jgi:phage shock protein PspC (stress-responsive transcriptional regulator)
MKETINANIGQRVFVLDRDAYDALVIYLNDVRRRIMVDTDEVMNDIEIRLAEIFHEELSSSMMVVTLAMVERAIVRVGRPEDFGSEGEGEKRSYNDVGNANTKQLRRSRRNRSIAGVCAGLADYLEVDVTLVRIITLCLMLFGAMSLWVYIIAWMLIPEE